MSEQRNGDLHVEFALEFDELQETTLENSNHAKVVEEHELEKLTDGDFQEPDESALLYNVNEVPPVGVMLSIAMQNILLGLGGALTTAYVISDVICATPDHPIRAKLFCTSLFMTGICTTLQSLVGVRLPIFQGVCSTFLVPLMAMKSDPRWKCENLNVKAGNKTVMLNHSIEALQDDELHYKLREMMGCLLLASVVEVLVGLTGLVGFLMRFIGPLTISVVISLIGLSLYKIPLFYVRTHWGMSSLCIVLTTVFMLYMGRVGIPCPSFCSGTKSKRQQNNKVSVFQMFPILLSILITWLVCGILTAAGVFPDDPSLLSYRARTDFRQGVISRTPWFYIPYPGQFGSPLFNTTIFVGFVSAVISSVLESIGDYYAAAHISRVPPPPRHAINRGILVEGIGSVLSGALGAGHATTSSTPCVALIGISKAASRSCLITAGVLCIVISVIGKFGAVLSTMPDPAIGGAMFVTFGVLGSIGIFTLRSIDLTSSRNLAIFGLSLYAGLVVPEWIERYPEAVATGNSTIDGIVKGILGTAMFLGGAVAVLLDNTVKGSLKERGFTDRDQGSGPDSYFVLTEADTYDLPYLNSALNKFPCLQRLPFLPKAKNM